MISICVKQKLKYTLLYYEVSSFFFTFLFTFATTLSFTYLIIDYYTTIGTRFAWPSECKSTRWSNYDDKKVATNWFKSFVTIRIIFSLHWNTN